MRQHCAAADHSSGRRVPTRTVRRRKSPGRCWRSGVAAVDAAVGEKTSAVVVVVAVGVDGTATGVRRAPGGGSKTSSPRMVEWSLPTTLSAFPSAVRSVLVLQLMRKR